VLGGRCSQTHGRSAKILLLARTGRLVLVTTRRALQEAERNLARDYGGEELERLRRDLMDADVEVVEEVTAEEEARWHDLTVEKDRHVLAGALKGGADVLVSLDKKHILTDRVIADFPIPVRSTQGFFVWWEQ
jgi:predicted nucleic acid-binding protein